MLSREYGTVFERTLQEVALAATDLDVPLVPFWPLRGAAYDGRLLVIGRSVNGWVEDWTPRQLRDEAVRRSAVAWMRADAEPPDRCRMRWVTDLWDGPHRVQHAPLGALARPSTHPARRLDPGGVDADHWSSLLVWTNLYKVSPGAGWNPGADLQRAQRRSAIELLALEIEAFAPTRVLALAGNWIDPFAVGLGLRVTRRPGLVERVGELMGRPCVVAKHPMGKPEGAFVAEVLRGFADLGIPMGDTPSTMRVEET
jgi:hypothetical protein